MAEKKKRFCREETLEPEYTYEAVMYGQKVIVKRYPSNVPTVDMFYADDSVIFSKDSPKVDF